MRSFFSLYQDKDTDLCIYFQLSEEKSETAGAAAAASATNSIPWDALKYGEPYSLQLKGWSTEAFVSPASDEYVFLRPENPLMIIFVSADGGTSACLSLLVLPF